MRSWGERARAQTRDRTRQSTLAILHSNERSILRGVFAAGGRGGGARQARELSSLELSDTQVYEP